MTAPAATAAVPELAMLERAVGYTRSALVAADGAAAEWPTPCSGWTLADLLAHMHDSLLALEQAGRCGRVDLRVVPSDPPAPASVARLVDALRLRACGLLGAWTVAGGERLVSVAGSPLRAGVLAAAGALEVAVHGWDVAEACGVDHPVPQALAEDLLAYLPLLVHPADRPRRFAEPVPVPGDAPAARRLLGLLGRA